MSYTFSVVEFTTKQVIGINVKTDMDNAFKDCSALWESFVTRVCPKLTDCSAVSKDELSYGVSQMINEHEFIYWAGVEITSTDALPDDLELMTIPGGLYVKCTVNSLAELGDAFNALYTQWPQTQDEYTFDMNGVWFELYGKNWMPDQPLEVYAAVVKK